MPRYPFNQKHNPSPMYLLASKLNQVAWKIRTKATICKRNTGHLYQYSHVKYKKNSSIIYQVIVYTMLLTSYVWRRNKKLPSGLNNKDKATIFKSRIGHSHMHVCIKYEKNPSIIFHVILYTMPGGGTKSGQVAWKIRPRPPFTKET